MPGVFDQTTVDRIQQANNIIDVISEHVRLTKRGREMVGVCPFHDDHRPSMYVSEVKQIFKCFACGAGGDVFKFIQMREQLTFPQAIERLAQRAGIAVRPVTTTRTGSDKQPGIDGATLVRVNEWACRHFQNNLCHETQGKAARTYVASRQISEESVRTWRLGLALPDGTDLMRAARQKGVPGKSLEAAGLITARGQDKFVNRLMFAITDVTGRVIGFGGRTLGDDRAKYVNSPGTALFDKSHCLYGLEQARHAMGTENIAVVVEGYTDCIMAHQAGCRNVVATLGTSLTSGHGRIMRRYAKTIVLIFDGDTAGLEAANRALDVCLKQKIDIQVAAVPEGQDPCDYLIDQGKPAFEALIAGAVDVLQFKWERLNNKFAQDSTLAGRRAAIDEFLQTVGTSIYAGQISAIDRGLIVNRLSRLIGLDARRIESELVRRIRTLAGPASGKETAAESNPAVWGRGVEAAAQRELLEVLLNAPELYAGIRDDISVETFTVPIFKQIAQDLFPCLDDHPSATGSEVLARIESVEAARAITELMRVGEEKGNFERRLQGAWEIMQHACGIGGKSDITDSERRLKTISKRSRNRHSLGLIE